VLHELYLAQISGASVIGWNDVVLAGRESVALYDMATRNPDDAIEAEHGAAHYVSPSRVLLDGLRAGPTAFDRGVLMAGRGRDSYAHWLIDFLPRLWIVDQFPEYDDWPLLIDAELHPQQVESLQHLNHKDRALLVLQRDTRYEVEQLILVSDLSCMRRQSFRPFARPSGREVAVAPDALAYLREAFAPGAADRPGSRRLYVSRRRQTKFRRLQNEAEVEQLFKSYGFEVIYPELLSHAQQVTAFSEARIVAGAAGSNMINTIFCPRGTQILMLAQWNAGLNYYFFPHLAALSGQQLTYVLGTVAQRHAYHYQHDFTVDPARVTRALEDILHARDDE
jgi:capsular polysaccharide biosynthesis protein